MHITLSGPYETLYTTGVDMWSFGCLCLNISIGKTAALKQREEASLLLSRNSSHFKELWHKTTKVIYSRYSTFITASYMASVSFKYIASYIHTSFSVAKIKQVAD